MDPEVVVLLITYERTPLAIETIQSIKKYLDWPQVSWHVADDGSSTWHRKAVYEAIGHTYNITTTNAQRGGVGKSMNMGQEIAYQRAKLVLWLEDDWVLGDKLALRPYVEKIMADESLGMIRLGRPGGVTEDWVNHMDDKLWYLNRSADHYVFSGNPALRHRRFFEAYGLYTEKLHPGQTEDNFCGRFRSAESGPGIAWPYTLTDSQRFTHIGDHQSYKWYMERGEKTAEEAAKLFKEQVAGELIIQ